MQQLPLDLKLADFALFETFVSAPNAAAVDAVRAAAAGQGEQVNWLWGPTGCGRSHLSQAAVAAAAGSDRTCAWLPLTDSTLVPGMLEGMGALDLLCVDDVQRVAGNPEWERALFSMFENLRAHGGRLVVTATVPPAGVSFSLRDLASRLASGPVWKLALLDEDSLLLALQRRAAWRGMELSAEAGVYLMRRIERTPSALFASLDQLDTAALSAQRKLTIPFIKSVLEAD